MYLQKGVEMATFTILGNINDYCSSESDLQNYYEEHDLDDMYFDQEIKSQGMQFEQLICERDNLELSNNNIFL